jgi:phenylacetate-CoA ligase
VITARELVSTGNKLRMLAVTKSREWASPERLARVQLRLLRRTLRTAYARVPLYREKFDKAGVHPDDLRSLADLARFPVTEKDEIRDSFPNGCTAKGTNLSRCRIQQTSGSTGQCMEIALDRWSDDARTLFTQRIYGMQGFTWWRRMAYLFPYPLPLQKNLGLYRNRHVDSKRPSREIMAELRAFRPHLLAATPSDLLDLLEGLDEDPSALRLLATCVHSEPMSCDERRFFERRLGCRVATNYYCNEVWAIAGECRAGSLHQFPDSVVLEIVDGQGRALEPGRTGNVIVTSLHNHAQPFVRYRLGDLAAWHASSAPCACGRRLPRLARIEGRDDDYLEYPDGRRVHPSKITVAVKSPCFRHPGRQIFRDFRITQDGPAHVTVDVVPGRDGERFEECARQSLANLQELLGPPFQVDLRTPSRLERGSGGKRKIVERLLSSSRS